MAGRPEVMRGRVTTNEREWTRMGKRDMLSVDYFKGETMEEYAPGKWRPAKVMPGPFWWRVKDAWLVLTGKAEAVVWR